MPNWCQNSLAVSSSCDQEQVIIESLFNGELENRTDEITAKLRKMLLAGLGGVLLPSDDIEPSILEAAGNLHADLFTKKRNNSEAGKAYTEFLSFLVNGTISTSNYNQLDSMYKKTGLEDLWWGDISKQKRTKIKSTWKQCKYDFSGCFTSDISLWWSRSDLYKNSSLDGVFDMRPLTEIPARIMINGFNGKALNCGRTYNWYSDNLGTKWPVVEFHTNRNENYVFDTAWSPVIPVTHLLPTFVAEQLNKQEDDLEVKCDLFFFETGCAFQGINEETYPLDFTWNEEEGFDEEDLLPEIANAFT